MHELSIAESVIAVVERHAAGRRVTGVTLRVGHLRQVVPSALQFAFELLTTGTSMDGARLEIESVPARVTCRACGATTELKWFPLRCSRCSGIDVEVLAGEELLVDALELEEQTTTEGIAHGG